MSESQEINPSDFRSETENIKQQLLKPFTDEELDSVWDEINRWRRSSFANDAPLLRRVAEEYVYTIDLHHYSDARYFRFKLINEHDLLADIDFEENENAPGVWTVPHRLVHTDVLGITGTEYLQQAEDYLLKLKEKNYIRIDRFEANVRQSGVTKWFLKNGYQFKSEEDKQKFTEYLDNPEDYCVIEIPSLDEDFQKEPFLFKKSDIDLKQIQDLYETGNPNIPMEIPSKIEADLDFYSIHQLKGLVSTDLIKVIDEGVAK